MRGRNVIPERTVPKEMFDSAVIYFLPVKSDSDCLNSPGTIALNNGRKLVRLAITLQGYQTVIRGIARNCSHRSVTLFNLAFCIAHYYRLVLKHTDLDDPSCTIDFGRLQLSSVYTLDRTYGERRPKWFQEENRFISKPDQYYIPGIHSRLSPSPFQ
ncbi:hypothetical protein B0H17DRAFT_1216821 [Mycena rosella]|uniref:Uncharacterized protein n=1 Tax=Mycena rosella TaxID=1033263 RepID=A0AAD7FQZ3_MYCRO|nr:hypothetical protein B0H17DRAFT_1216821 [Mycena rosella]